LFDWCFLEFTIPAQVLDGGNMDITFFIGDAKVWFG
jgi:hypothetical protein